MSPLTVKVNIADVPSIVAATTLLSLPVCPVIFTVVLEASADSPMSKSISLLLPVQVIFAVTVPQDELLPVLSQLKSMLLEFPVTFHAPV